MSTHACTAPAAGEILGRRLLAYLIDGFVLMAFFFIASIGFTFVAPVGIAAFFVSPAAGFVAVAVCAVLAGAAPYLGLALVMSLWEGQTPGHRALGLRVVRDDGRPMSVCHAFVREFLVKVLALGLRWICTLGVLAVVDLVRLVRDPEERMWHDSLCRTTVVLAA